MPGINDQRADRDAIDIIYKKLGEDREKADITEIMRELQRVVDQAIDPLGHHERDATEPFDISKIDFDRLRQEFTGMPNRNTTVQSLKAVIEQRLRRMLAQNPLRTDFQQRYEEIVKAYNREKDRVMIERTFEELLKLEGKLAAEERRAVREGLDEESLAMFDLLRKPDLRPADIKKIKRVAVDLLAILKAQTLSVHQWRDKESTRAAVKIEIRNFLYRDDTGLPAPAYTDRDVNAKIERVYRHIHYAYPQLPSPLYSEIAA